MNVKKSLLGCLGVLLGLAFAGLSHAAEASGKGLAGGVRPLSFELNGKWIGSGVCFSPFRHGQGPGGASPSDAQILEDLQIANRHWGLFRTYELSEVVLTELRLIRQHKLPIRVMLGVWIEPEKTPADVARNDQQVALGIQTAREYSDIVCSVIVGNETQVEWSGIRTDPTVLINRIRQVRAGVVQPVTTADDYNFWNKPQSAAVAAEVDYIDLHMYVLWNGKALEDAMVWTDGVYRDICAKHPDRFVMIGETGWATCHDINKNGPGQEGSLMKAETSEVAQYQYLKQFYTWIRKNKVPTLLFEAFDENWKGSGTDKNPMEGEKHWGVYTEDRRMKASFQAITLEFPEVTR